MPGLHFAADSMCQMCLSSFSFFLPVSVKLFLARVRFHRSRSSKVTDFGTNRKRIFQFDFLLVRRSNLGPILHRFRDIAGFCAHDSTPIPLQFWSCSRYTRSPTLGQPDHKPKAN